MTIINLNEARIEAIISALKELKTSIEINTIHLKVLDFSLETLIQKEASEISKIKEVLNLK